LAGNVAKSRESGGFGCVGEGGGFRRLCVQFGEKVQDATGEAWVARLEDQIGEEDVHC
jgi:hypothetical protein